MPDKQMIKMAYRINAHFANQSYDGWLGDIIAAPPPQRGDVISVNRFGRDIPMQVTAVWTPSEKMQRIAGVIMIEASEIQ
ncbi:MAG TPA: hypothetical protein VGM68_07490 [Rhizomicrobium sp.]|jgi:hypothetical protein